MSYVRRSTSFLCRHCGTQSTSEILGSKDFIETENDGRDLTGPEYRYRMVSCAACGDVSLLVAMKLYSDDEDGIYDDDFAVYPAPPRSISSAVPANLQNAFAEARTCYQARAYIASAIMCRRALESLAIERGVTERNLARSLEKLRDQGDIDSRLYDWCNELRLAGNEAAHDVGRKVTQEDARDMNDLTEAIIDYVFVFQARYEQFQKRRSGK